MQPNRKGLSSWLTRTIRAQWWYVSRALVTYSLMVRACIRTDDSSERENNLQGLCSSQFDSCGPLLTYSTECVIAAMVLYYAVLAALVWMMERGEQVIISHLCLVPS